MRGNVRGSAGSLARTATVAACALVLLATACADRQKKDAAVDADLSRDLQLASQVATQPAPTFQDTALQTVPVKQPVREQPAPKPAPARTARRERARAESPTRMAAAPPPRAETPTRAPAPTPAPVPSQSAAGRIAAGTGVSMSSNSKVCTDSSRPGDKIVATVTSPTVGSNGAEIPAGAKVVLEVASITPASSSDPGQIYFRVKSLYLDDTSHPLTGDVAPTASLDRVKVAGDPNGDKKKVIGGAVAGAILGQILGHSTKATVIGAATGAAAGAVASKVSERYESCLPEGASLHLTLAEPLVLQTAAR